MLRRGATRAGRDPDTLEVCHFTTAYLGADRTGVPFTGDRSGRRVQTLLIRLGLSLETDPAVAAPRLHGALASSSASTACREIPGDVSRR